MDTSIFTDPVKIGPGIWFSLHIEAVKCTSDDTKKSFIIFVNSICDNFKCAKCQIHFRTFINTHPFLLYWNIKDAQGRDIGFYKWTWELHNQVNKFLNKPQPSLMESYNYYVDHNSDVCHNCGNQPVQQPHQNVLRSKQILTPIDSQPSTNGFKLIPRPSRI